MKYKRFYYDDNERLGAEDVDHRDLKKELSNIKNDSSNLMYYDQLFQIVIHNYSELNNFVKNYKTDCEQKNLLYAKANRYALNFYNSFSTYINFLRGPFTKKNPMRQEIDLSSYNLNNPIYRIMKELRNSYVHKEIMIKKYNEDESEFYIESNDLENNSFSKNKTTISNLIKQYKEDKGINSSTIPLSQFVNDSLNVFSEIDWKVRNSVARHQVFPHINFLINLLYRDTAGVYYPTSIVLDGAEVSINNIVDIYVTNIKCFFLKEDPINIYAHMAIENKNYYGFENIEPKPEIILLEE